MDSRVRLDYALFQLTPTRTRCDLIICAGDCKEKLASGLLEPFISHLNFVKDEAAKGGYSITLSAPASVSWFTKSTIERFVRFVSTPEILERFITIEREIKNIDRSINTNASSDSQTIYSLDEDLNKSSAFGHKHEDDTSDPLHEEDSKFHLQRVLETRKAALQREQAMVYARATVVGFETDFLQDLICFADAFGSPRLREACLNFIELCNTKSNDRVWMDEVAAMQVYSPSQHAYMEDDLGQELRINVQNGNFATKSNNENESHLPQSMHSYPGGSVFHPPYQGYPFPYYQGNLPCPPNVEDSRSRGRHSHKKRSQELTQGDNFDLSDSSSESDSGSHRSSSQTVIIRNINYIASARDEESEHESDVDQNLEGEKVTQQWDIFQNLLLNDVDDKESEEEHEVTYLRRLPDKELQEKSRHMFEDPMESTKDVLVNYSDSLKTYDSLMVSESNLTQKKVAATYVNEPNDLHMVLERDTAGQQAVPVWTPEMESRSSNRKIDKMDSPEVKKSKTKALVEKGLEKKGSTIEAKSKALAGSRRKTPAATKTTILKGRSEKEEEKRKKMEELLTQRRKRIAERSVSTANIANSNKPKAQETKHNNKPKAQQTTKNDKPKSLHTMKNDKSKSQQTTKNDKPKAQQTTKNEAQKAQQIPKSHTLKAQLASQDMKRSHKTVMRSSTIDRLSVARVVNPKVLPTKSKPGNKPMKPPTKKNSELKPVRKPTKVTAKENGVSRSFSSQKTVKPLDKNTVSKNSFGPKKKIVDHNNSLPKASKIKKAGNGAAAHIGLFTPAYSQQTKSVSETLPKASLVLQKDITLSHSNGGSTTRAVNSVSFKLNEDIGGAKKNHIAKAKHEFPATEIFTPLPAKLSPERRKPRKKWSSLETSSKALSGLKKLLHFGRSN